MQIKPAFDQRNCERRIVDAFVKYYLNSNGRHYEFICRPEEKYPQRSQLPDFEYRDMQQESVALIELGIITAPYKLVSKYRTIHSGFRKLCRELECERTVIGEFWLVIPYDNIRKRKSEKWETYFKRIKTTVQRKANSMHVGDREVIDNILLLKCPDTGYSWCCSPPPLFTELVPKTTDWLEETIASVKKIADLFKEAGEKFTNYRMNNSTNFLLLLHKGYEFIRDDVSESIKWVKAGLFAKEHCSLPIFSGLYEVDILILDPFGKKDITLCSCYPHSKSVGLCSYSQVFRDTDEMNNCLEYYFPV